MNINKLSPEYTRKVLGYYAEPSERVKRDVKELMVPFGLENIEDANQPVELPLPENPLFSDVIERALSPYDVLISKIDSITSWDVPDIPERVPYIKGWSLYSKGKWHDLGSKRIEGKVMIFDVETVEVSNGQWYPVVAVGMSNKGFIFWQADFNNLGKVIPLGTNNVIVGHNIAYDRSYIREEYELEDSGNKFFDTLSAWVVTRGLSNQQRPLYLDDDVEIDWMDETSTNGLDRVYEFYFREKLEKGVRDGIVSEGLSFVKSNREEVIKYCLLDVVATFRVFKRLYPEYKTHRPSKISQVGHLLLGSTWLPLCKDRFPGFYDRVEGIYQEIVNDTQETIMELADSFLEKYPVPTLEHHNDMDWEVAKSGVNKGKPKWYRDLLSKYRLRKLSVSQRTVGYLLGLKYKGEYLRYCPKNKGWYTDTNGFLKHPEDPNRYMMYLFIKPMVSVFEDGIISSDLERTNELIHRKVSCINWVSSRKRVLGIYTYDPNGYPVTLPRISPNGTVTGRAVDSLWQVVANPKKTRLGTELKSMVSPPDGYVFVGADVASEEAWLAGCFGDSLLGYCGSSPLGLITIAGSKKKTLEESTDIHSVMAKQTNMTRDNTKTRVYGALYGQGVQGDFNLLLKSIPLIDPEDARQNSKLFMQKFKGVKSNGKYVNGLASASFGKMEKIANSKCPRTPLTGAILSKALAGVKDFSTSRVNWTIQSSGVDFRDLLVILTLYFYGTLGVRGRLLITIHDEIRTMVKEEDIEKACYALQLAHLYTRVAFIDAFGLDCIPAGIAWFEGIDVDEYCLRKEPTDPQITPSQPDGLPLGYIVEPKDVLTFCAR